MRLCVAEVQCPREMAERTAMRASTRCAARRWQWREMRVESYSARVGASRGGRRASGGTPLRSVRSL